MAKFKRLFKISQCYHTNNAYQLPYISYHFKKSMTDYDDYNFYNTVRFIGKGDPDYNLPGITRRNKSKISKNITKNKCISQFS